MPCAEWEERCQVNLNDEGTETHLVEQSRSDCEDINIGVLLGNDEVSRDWLLVQERDPEHEQTSENWTEVKQGSKLTST
jgi:hypothetical protein